MKTTVVGLGLIGGCIAIDLRKSGMISPVTGVDKNQAHGEAALNAGWIDGFALLAESLHDAELVIVAIPVNAIEQILPIILDSIPETAVVIDAGSTKRLICAAVKDHPNRGRFVAAHPIAGTENSGPLAAFGGLFQGKTNIICEKDASDPDAQELALRIFRELGMNTIFMEPEEHDRHVAYVSHLSHVSAFLLGQTVMDIEKDEENIFALAGSGFASTVRLAKSSPDMWAPIFEQNREFLSQALQEYIMHLQKFHYHLLKKDTAEVHRIMLKANEIRRVLEGIEPRQRTNDLSLNSLYK